MDPGDSERSSSAASRVATNLSPRVRDLLKRYGVAVALASVALLLRRHLPLPEGTAIYQLPLAAVVLSAWYGGRGPGLFAVLICATGILYWIIPPADTFELSADYALGFSIFIALCLLLSEFSAGRRKAEHAFRASEERFRTLMQFSFDVYWESDAEHRFTRQEFSERLTDAPSRGAEIGKTRWEIPYLEPGEEAWREHRDTLDAHLPFRDFELARPAADGGKRYVSVSGIPVFDSAGRFVGHRGVGRHITERKRVEAELRARQDMLDLAQKAGRAVAFDWFIGARERENRWSPELEAMYGLEPGTFDGTFQSWKKLVHPDDWPAAKVALKRAQEAGDIAAEYRVTHKDGTVHWLRAKGRMFFDAAGQPERMVGFMIDITDLRHAEEEHRTYLWFLESMDRVNRAIQGADELDRMTSEVLRAALEIFACDRAWLVYPCDPRAASWRAVMEHTRPQFPGAFALGEELPMDAEVAAVFEAAQAAPGPVFAGSCYDLKIPASADRFSVRSQIAMAIDAKGDKRHLFGLHQCSHARVWTGEEQRLFQEIGRRLGDAIATLSMLRGVRDSERKLDAAQRIAHVGWWERDFVNKRVSLSDEAQRIFGVEPVDLPQWQDRWVNLIHPEDRARAAAAAAAALRGGPRYDVEYRVIRPDGTVRVVHSQGDMAWDESGRPARQFGVMQDITELRFAEEELRASEARFRTFVDHATDAFFLHDDDLLIVDVNRQACDSLGYSREELIGMHPRDFDVGLDAAAVARLAQRVGTGESVTFETLHRRKDGTTFPVEVRAGMFEQTDSRFRLSLVRDIGDRKLTEETLRAREDALQVTRAELARVSRVMTMGELTASIAHEVNQPLGAMVANAAACARWLAAEPAEIAKTRKALDSIAADGRRAGEVIGRIRALVKREAPRKLLLDINQKVRDMVALTEQEMRSQGIVLELRLTDGLPEVAGDRVQLQQVLLNLLVNAIEAMGDVHDRPRALTIVSSRDGADAVVVEVRDSGSGLDAERAERLFEAFYTTKSEGIGIGLSISRSIAEAHGGSLLATPNSPHGAAFKLWLPAAGPG
jgi:PAS domain S-box-containing protein